jgi:hypothetical protein
MNKKADGAVAISVGTGGRCGGKVIRSAWWSAALTAVGIETPLGVTPALAQSATWLATPTVTNPADGNFDFDANANWNPATVPGSASASDTGTATFRASSGTGISFSSSDNTLGGFTFAVGVGGSDATTNFGGQGGDGSGGGVGGGGGAGGFEGGGGGFGDGGAGGIGGTSSIAAVAGFPGSSAGTGGGAGIDRTAGPFNTNGASISGGAGGICGTRFVRATASQNRRRTLKLFACIRRQRMPPANIPRVAAASSTSMTMTRRIGVGANAF